MFTYELPEERIAQRPIGGVRERALAKLLVAKKCEGQLVCEDYSFSELSQLLRPGDLLVLNDSRVIPCRFFSKRESDGRELELLLVKKVSGSSGGEVWEALGRPLKYFEAGSELFLSEHLAARVGLRINDGRGVEVEIFKRNSLDSREIFELIELDGLMPIPPYIRRGRSDQKDREDYQTIYSQTRGSIAAPTAGLHFTEELLACCRDKGIEVGYVTLHVGVGSFLPIDEQAGNSHKQALEEYVISKPVAERLLKQKEMGNRVVAVGTTVVRALESWWLAGVPMDGQANSTELFITPGFLFSVVDGLITNFHQPRSTHLQLVAAFIGEAECKSLYQHALAADYRFLSYGDAMFLSR